MNPMSTENCTTVQRKKRAVSYGEILKGLPSRSRDLVTAEYRHRGGSLDRVDAPLLARSIYAVEYRVQLEHPMWTERAKLRNIRRRLEL